MKNCLIVAATAKEIAPFLKDLRSPEPLIPPNISVDVLLTGVGLVATAYHLSRQIQLKRPELVIQAGIAGGFDRKLKLGTVVAIQREQVADLGVSGPRGFQSIFSLGLAKKNQFPYTNGWLINQNKALLGSSRLKAVTGISVNQVSTSASVIRSYRKTLSPSTESMEGAALHYVCLNEKIPFIQIRSISNYVGERNKKKWKVKEAIHTLNMELMHLIHNL